MAMSETSLEPRMAWNLKLAELIWTLACRHCEGPPLGPDKLQSSTPPLAGAKMCRLPMPASCAAYIRSARAWSRVMLWAVDDRHCAAWHG
eukprot:7238603-Prymnesium_polylepis.2